MIFFPEAEVFEVTKLTILKIAACDVPIFIIWFSLQEKIEWGKRMRNVEKLNKTLKEPVIT